jgi:hypothetical protein
MTSGDQMRVVMWNLVVGSEVRNCCRSLDWPHLVPRNGERIGLDLEDDAAQMAVVYLEKAAMRRLHCSQ